MVVVETAGTGFGSVVVDAAVEVVTGDVAGTDEDDDGSDDEHDATNMRTHTQTTANLT